MFSSTQTGLDIVLTVSRHLSPAKFRGQRGGVAVDKMLGGPGLRHDKSALACGINDVNSTGKTSVLSAPLSDMLASPNLSLDLIVTAGGTPIACNKSSLAANSGYFSHRLSLLSANPTSPPSLDLPTVPADVFRSLLLFMYTGRLELTEENVYQLFWYSQMLQIPSALLHCTHFISTRPPPPPPPLPPALPPALPPPAPPGTVVRPVARQGVPLLSLPSLASLYTDWVLRSSSSTTRLVTPDTTEENQTGSSRSQELKEKERGER